jgi:hypothetical protein
MAVFAMHMAHTTFFLLAIPWTHDDNMQNIRLNAVNQLMFLFFTLAFAATPSAQILRPSAFPLLQLY